MMWMERFCGVSYLPNPREDQLHPRKFLLAEPPSWLTDSPGHIPILKRHSYNALGLPKAFSLLISDEVR